MPLLCSIQKKGKKYKTLFKQKQIKPNYLYLNYSSY